jgi:fructose-1,6-bisphosphatase/inositol monophosphatase family enzyme
MKTADVRALQHLAQTAALRTEETCGIALCHVACGRADAAVCTSRCYAEFAAGCLIAREAGVSLNDLRGGALALRPGAKQGATAAGPGIALALTAITARF